MENSNKQPNFRFVRPHIFYLFIIKALGMTMMDCWLVDLP